LGDYYYDQYGEGNREVINVLSVEEANLLHARYLAHTYGWWRRVISTMQGLLILYDHTGRRAEWKRLVEELMPDFVDPETDGPLPGREENWSLVTQYRVLLAEEARAWEEAERLQGLQVEWTRGRSAPALALPADRLDDQQRNATQSLAVSAAQLGQIQREQGDAACVTSYVDNLAVVHSQLGNAYGEAGNVDQALTHYRESIRYKESAGNVYAAAQTRHNVAVVLARARHF
jgi:hypothetical protein